MPQFHRTTIGQAQPATNVSLLEFHKDLSSSIYINDLPTCLKHTSVMLFADDAALYCSDGFTTDAE